MNMPLLRTVAACLPLLALLLQPRSLADTCPDPMLRGERAGNHFILRWHAESGKTQLVWAPVLDDPAAWQPVAGQGPAGEPDSWQAAFEMLPPRAFFKIIPAGPPAAPPNFQLVSAGGIFRLEWDSQCDASGYVVYIGTTADVGQAHHLQSLTLGNTNSLEIDGLTPGQTYFITVAATNAAGQGQAAAALSGVFGPQGVVSGQVVQAFHLADGKLFHIEAPGAVVVLTDSANPAALPLSANADEGGQFRIRHVLPGVYRVQYLWQGRIGVLPDALNVPAGGAALSPLEIHAGPGTPAPDQTLIGHLTLSTGDAARCDLPEFGISSRSLLTASLADGSARQVVPDRNGRWALTDLAPGSFPVTLTGTYRDLNVQQVIDVPPAVLAPVSLQFATAMPKTHRITAWQNGAEVMEIQPGVPVTFHAEIDNPAKVALEPRWIAEFNGQRLLSTEASATFTFDQPEGPPGEGAGDPQDSGLVRLRFLPSCYAAVDFGPLDIAVVDWIRFRGCWSGTVAAWHQNSPFATTPGHPATVTLSHSAFYSPDVVATTPNAGGYFEISTDPVSRAPYLIRVEKADHMRFLWPFEFQLPKESQFCVIPADVYNLSQSASPLVITHPTGTKLTLPPNSLLDPSNVPWTGNIVVRMVSFDPRLTHPLPPNPEMRSGANRRGIAPYGAAWIDIRTDTNVPLTPSAAATLEVHTSQLSGNGPATIATYQQNESTGYFEPWTVSSKVSTRQYAFSLGRSGLFLLGNDQPLVELVFEADRSLNYPFDVLIGGWNFNLPNVHSIFPVTIEGACRNNFGHLYVAQGSALQISVIDVRHGPGLFHQTISPASAVMEDVNKPLVSRKTMVPNTPAVPLPAIAAHWVRLSLADAEPDLKNLPTDTTVTTIATANHFLSRGGVNSAADAAAYYAKINAPATLSAWRSLSGLPQRFGGPLTGVGAGDYATAYYYNLGDLGFARAQTMRVKTSALDGLPDVAFAVTNYESLEDARCGRGPVATVCMDYSSRIDNGAVTPSRYTRFYVYGSNGALLQTANLDGAGLKGVPNLCITCHGGDWYSAGGPTNVGARFLPFDLESYTFHPKFGIQHQELAAMNAAVLKTAPTAATADLIAGWYGTPNPLANPLAFNQSHVPTAAGLSWAANPGVYSNFFKQACRVCHNSRDSNTSMQFEKLIDLSNYGYGHSSACLSLQMPHAQRTWSGYWGSRCAANLGFSVQDMPTHLGTAAGQICR
jgi:hypothetical protein